MLLLSSCSFYRDTTTYFNVYYDAQRHIERYEEKVEDAQTAESGAVAAVTTHRWLDEEYESRKTLRIRGAEPPPVKFFFQSKDVVNQKGDVKHLDSAIILGSKILADKHPSKYVEGALFITGKALYYKNDYSGARRKFNELLFKFPQTEFASEVGRLLTKTLIITRQYDTASTAILASIERLKTSDDNEEVAATRLMYAELLLMRGAENIPRAAEQLELAEALVDDDDASRIAYERGALRYIEGNWAEAEKAFAKTRTITSDTYILGEALMAHALTLRRLGRFNEAKTELEEILSKTRFSASHPAANYELAVTVEEEARAKTNGRFRDANFTQHIYPKVRQTYYILDTTYRNISQAIMVRSRFRQAELFRAMGEYDSGARIANIIIGTKDFSSAEINDYVNERMRALQRFAQQKNILERTEKLERLITRVRENGGNILATMQREIRTMAERLILGARWRPDGPNTITVEEEKLIAEQEVRIKREREASGEPISMLRMTDTNLFIDSVKFSAAKAHYELGRAYEVFGEPANAAVEYFNVLDKQYVVRDTSKTNFNARTLFSWIELEHQRKNYQTRDSLIQLLTTSYGESKYASAASRLYSGNDGGVSPGEKSYAVAAAAAALHGFDSQRSNYLAIVTNYVHEDVAPRSLYAIGINYEESSQFDSAVFYYKRVVSEYPFSRYAEEVRPRLLLADVPKNVIVTPEVDTAKDSMPIQMDTIDPNRITPQQDPVDTILDGNNSNGIGVSPGMMPPPKRPPKK